MCLIKEHRGSFKLSKLPSSLRLVLIHFNEVVSEKQILLKRMIFLAFQVSSKEASTVGLTLVLFYSEINCDSQRTTFYINFKCSTIKERYRVSINKLSLPFQKFNRILIFETISFGSFYCKGYYLKFFFS